MPKGAAATEEPAPPDTHQDAAVVPAPPDTDQDATVGESPRMRARRHALRTRLHGYALLAVALFAVVIALAASNTTAAKVSWVVGSSHVSLVWLVLVAAVAGWLLGVLTVGLVHRHTRAPRPPRAGRG